MVQGPLRTADAARRAAALPHYVSSVAPEDLDASVTYDLAWFQVLHRQRARCVAVPWGGDREGERERGREGERGMVSCGHVTRARVRWSLITIDHHKICLLSDDHKDLSGLPCEAALLFRCFYMCASSSQCLI